MLKLEEIKTSAMVRGIQGEEIVKIVQTEAVGEHALTVYYKDSQGRLGEQMLYRNDEARLFPVTEGRPWAFDAAGEDFKLALEALRIQMARFFDPMMAVHTSSVEPLPHQIAAVYESMLPRQPLRFVLADDPGAGKTIMAGLLIRELILRADARRILIVSPGSLSEQWQDELREKFGLLFEVFSREKQETCPSGNYFEEQDQLICRLDQLSRNEDYQEKIKTTRWDLIIVDEAHKMSASYFGSKVKRTNRFRLGELLGSLTRHFLLMTATPHNGKEEDFQIWLSLLDSDRFYGKFREGAHKVDVSDMMRRMVKEELLKFDGTPLFPERRAYTAGYDLSDAEAALYAAVTEYVRNEMNRAEKLSGQKKNNVGFALTQLQRRLASSPEAIYQSLKRRHKKLESRLQEMRLVARGMQVGDEVAETLGQFTVTKKLDIPDNLDDLEEELNAEEYELYADQVVDQASAAESIPELEAEIHILAGLEKQACALVQSEKDKKWEELSRMLQDTPEMRLENGELRKLIIFTEHRDTLNYLVNRIRSLLGRQEAVITIHGGTNRDARRKAQELFRNDHEVRVLVATDAAGEGVNLQNANLMVNYDLPWNPNRLEQRFGRIHRIGQTEICHLWNLVAKETREGDVFQRLFDKIEVEKKALGGKVFDILGEAFENHSLKDLLIEAILYGESPERQAEVHRKIESCLDTEHLKEILKRQALVDQHMGLEELYAVREEMEKAEARKLQPYFVHAFFVEAFKSLGGELRPREKERFEIRHVPATIREQDRAMGESRTPVLKRYERVCFEKNRIPGKNNRAELLHPGHPLMKATTECILMAHRSRLKQGAVLLDPADEGTEPRLLFMVDHSIRQSSGTSPKEVSRRLHFVFMDAQGLATRGGWAPHLDLEPFDKADLPLIQDILQAPWISSKLEDLALKHASEHLVPEHYTEVRERCIRQADKILGAVQERLVKEINYLYGQALKLEEDVKAGRQPRMQPENRKREAEELTARLEQRQKEVAAMKEVVSSTPIILGGALVIPAGLLAQRKGEGNFCTDAAARKRVEEIAMQAVMEAEKKLGHSGKDVSHEKCGWDITARPPQLEDGSIRPDRHIEVKGRAKGADFITITRNEILCALNQTDKFILAIVLVDGDKFEGPFYIKNPFEREPDFGITSSNYRLDHLLEKALRPEESL
ncbi:SNF2 domain-containing protein [Desulfobotulus alkaliphilus]|uniref:SNF2 domain-containing protein n=1 Tax=Desulfobotulus alkaliphilus TaxID=622671 RepID=A0A562R2W7_9BACT|nr:helicase-related protein [Desulfobotulus alkaliphilus]TWI63408.1 SNF2 domain-containing protein [Desulfobotulus alkaliphilus]